MASIGPVDSNGFTETCRICTKSILNSGNKVIGICLHVFCEHCIQDWITRGDKSCPLCKRKWKTSVKANAASVTAVFQNLIQAQTGPLIPAPSDSEASSSSEQEAPIASEWQHPLNGDYLRQLDHCLLSENLSPIKKRKLLIEKALCQWELGNPRDAYSDAMAGLQISRLPRHTEIPLRAVIAHYHYSLGSYNVALKKVIEGLELGEETSGVVTLSNVESNSLEILYELHTLCKKALLP